MPFVITLTGYDFDLGVRPVKMEESSIISKSQQAIITKLWISGNSGLIQAEIARLRCRGKASTGCLIDRLEIMGYVERRADLSNRRIKRVYLTEEGILAAKIYACHE
jgi:DNA-binding MarR family transcriptional regulator